ncbi:MAG TPA: ABC transporter substrate-binding protein [Terriglobales bacterium]|nr:ABC transporter substrate-binding protein [Terriglobales bacterium]
MRKFAVAITLLLPLLGCAKKPDPGTLVMIIEASPLNLDPRVGTDAQSERIYELLFDALLRRDEHFNVVPGLAEHWEMPDPRTYVFHLRPGVRFADGQPLTSRDVKWTFDSLLQKKIRSTKGATYQFVTGIDAPDAATVVFHLSQPWATLLFNLSEGAIGIVPYGAGEDFNLHPVGSGPYRLVRNITDNEVVIERNQNYWGEPARIARVRFTVIPDTTTRALELRKGSADLLMNALTADMVATLRADPRIAVETGPGSTYTYIGMNLRDPILKDVRVRQALAYAIDRAPMIHYIWRDLVEPASSVLPPEHWAYDATAAQYQHDPARAKQLLDAAGYAPGKDGIRFRLSIKTTAEEWNRLLGAILQQQLREVGIAVDIRSSEFATFYADVQKGAFQLFTGLRWTGGSNQDPDIFEYVFYSSSIPPRRANRGFYSSPKVDALIDAGRQELDQQKRRAIYLQVQDVLNQDLPYIHLWFFNTVIVHSTRVTNVKAGIMGNYDFLTDVQMANQHSAAAAAR